MKLRHLIAAAAIALTTTPSCHAPQGVTAAESREVVVGFASAVAALEVLDALHAERMRQTPEPTDEQYAWFVKQTDQLRRLRDLLAIARGWLTGDRPEEEGRAALRDGATVLQMLIDELRANSVKVPESVDAGLAVLKAFT